MNEASEIFNTLPTSTRKAAAGVIIEARILQINADLKAAKRAYDQYQKSLLSHRRNLEKSLMQWKQSEFGATEI